MVAVTERENPISTRFSTPAPITSDEIFVAKLDELASRSTLAGGEHDTLAIAAALRLLLLDGLVHKANRSHRLKLRFTITDIEPDLGVQHWDPTSVLYPVPATILAIVDLNLDQFLARTAFVVESRAITVKQLILFFANSEGGVHMDDSAAGDRAILRLWRTAGRVISAQGEERTSLAHVLAGISRIVVDALAPLRKAVLSTLPAGSRDRLGGPV